MRFALVLLLFLLTVDLGSAAEGTGEATAAAGLARAQREVTFRADVQAVLSKAGCNMGACHGNAKGKGGLFLALRGQDPDFDYDSLARDLGGRRVNRVVPEQSLMLLKPTAQVPHEGGQRFAIDSPEYRILRDWIATGLPLESDCSTTVTRLQVTPDRAIAFADTQSLPLQVVAEFADGRREDVTHLAVYEPSSLIAKVTADGVVERQSFGEATVTVRYLRSQRAVRVAFMPGATSDVWHGPATQNYVDEHILAKLQQLRIPPSPIISDRLFLRRVYLDVLGILPTEQEAESFLGDRHANKRQRLIERLLAHPAAADQWALQWSDVLRNEEKLLDSTGVDAFHAWLRDSFAHAQPLDQFAAALVSSLGSTYEVPPTNFYRAHRDPQSRAVAVARVFLGYRLQCAQCHNHPYDVWTQDDYYDWSAVFASIGYEIKDNKRRDEFDKHEFIGEQIVHTNETETVTNPRTGEDAHARLLTHEVVEQQGGKVSLEDLAEWLTSVDNRAFARAQVNRIWFHLMGRGLVDPVDDFRATNPASHPELLEALVDHLIASDFDVRQVMRVILNSVTYQLSTEAMAGNELDSVNYSHALVRRLTAEQLLDAQAWVLGAAVEFNGYPRGLRAGQLPGVQRVRPRDEAPSPGDRFLKMFGKPDRLLACECERSNDTHLGQALSLVAGDTLNEMLIAPHNILSRWLERELPNEQLVERLFWRALERRPTTEELAAALAQLEVEDRRAGLEDVAWAVLNSQEFLFRP